MGYGSMKKRTPFHTIIIVHREIIYAEGGGASCSSLPPYVIGQRLRESESAFFIKEA